MEKLLNSAKKNIDFWAYLFKTSAPLGILGRYFIIKLTRLGLRKHKKKRNEFREFVKSLNFSGDWFSSNVPSWMFVINKYGLASKEVKALEIGSWEGMSSCFTLWALPKAHLTCVDTWAGADEHQGMDELAAVEKKFDSNTSAFKERLAKFKGTSFNFFNSCNEKGTFDLVYVDGSHHCDDVIIDAIKGFELLKIGGLMIFDDYLWNYYERAQDNPATAINAFLKMKRGCFEIVLVGRQVTIRKTRDRV